MTIWAVVVKVSPMPMQLFTSGDLARILGVKDCSVRHILHSRRQTIRPCHVAGICRLYDEQALYAVKREWEKISAVKERRLAIAS